MMYGLAYVEYVRLPEHRMGSLARNAILSLINKTRRPASFHQVEKRFHTRLVNKTKYLSWCWHPSWCWRSCSRNPNYTREAVEAPKVSLLRLEVDFSSAN